MDQNFSLMAQSRANYYTAGSPVQFVRVELLKGDVTGEVAEIGRASCRERV